MSIQPKSDRREKVCSNIVNIRKIKFARCTICQHKLKYNFSLNLGHHWLCKHCGIIGVMPIRKFNIDEFERACCVCGIDFESYLGEWAYNKKLMKKGLLT